MVGCGLVFADFLQVVLDDVDRRIFKRVHNAGLHRGVHFAPGNRGGAGAQRRKGVDIEVCFGNTDLQALEIIKRGDDALVGHDMAEALAVDAQEFQARARLDLIPHRLHGAVVQRSLHGVEILEHERQIHDGGQRGEVRYDAEAGDRDVNGSELVALDHVALVAERAVVVDVELDAGILFRQQLLELGNADAIARVRRLVVCQGDGVGLAGGRAGRLRSRRGCTGCRSRRGSGG